MSHDSLDSAPDGAQAVEAIQRAEDALAAADLDGLLALLHEHGLEMGARHLDRLEALMAALPAHALESHPQLLVLRHGISTFIDQDQPRASLDLAQQLRAMAPEGSSLTDRFVAGLGEIFALRSMGRLAECVEVVERDRALIASDREEWLELPGQMRSVILLQWGLSRMLATDLQGAISDFQEAYWAGRRTPLPHFARNGAENAAFLLALIDSLDEAEEWLGMARTIDRAPESLRHIVEEYDQLVLAAIALARCDVELADKELATFEPSSDTRLSWSAEAYLRARQSLLAGERLAGLDEVDRVQHPRGGQVVPGSLDELLLGSVEAELAIAAGRAPRATRVLGRLDRHPLVAAVRARHALMTGDAAGALAISVASADSELIFGRIDLAAISAVALLHLGRTAEAEVQFGHAVTLGRARGVVAPFVLLPRRDIERLCAHVPGAQELLGPVLAETSTSVERVDVVRLSKRERLVLAELARTGSVQTIADKHFVSVNTVKSQLRSIYRKLDVNSREGALAEALRLGLDLDFTG